VKNAGKTKEQLLKELGDMRKRIAEVESEVVHEQAMRELVNRSRTGELKSVSAFIDTITANFNNILTGVLGNITLAQRYVEPKGKAFDRLIEAERACLRARDLTQQLLTFAKAQAQQATVASPIAGKGRILVMDDEEIIRTLLHAELTDIGYEVELTKEGAEAVKSYQEAKESGQPFDAVILDLAVPGGMGGKETVEKLLEIDPDVKAIVSSGHSTDPIVTDFKKYGFVGSVTKPYRVAELERTLRNTLDE